MLANRSNWFKTAFTGDFEVRGSRPTIPRNAATDKQQEAKNGKVHLQESPWQVDLMLYFLYSGGKYDPILLATVALSGSHYATGIDLDDEALTSGHDVMDISVELLRLGDFFQSTEMQQYGKNMLAEYLRNFLSRICSTTSIFTNSPAANKGSFHAEENFPQRFCSAVINAFSKDRPVKLAQDILADFAFAARIHLFRNKEFLSFIQDGVVPEFGNRVLTALMNGSVSEAFKGDSVFKHWKDWRVTPTISTLSKSEGSGLFGAASPGVSNTSTTATPRVASGSSTASPQVTSDFGTAPQPVTNGTGTAAPRATGGLSTPFSGAASASDTAPSPATSGSGAGPPPVSNRFGTARPQSTSRPDTATPRVPSGFGTASPDVAGSGRGSGRGNGGYRRSRSRGSTGPSVSGSTTSQNGSANHRGTVGLAFYPYAESEPNSTTVNYFQSILFCEPCKRFSAEELRMADYSQGRRYGDGPADGNGARETTFGFGGGNFGHPTTQNRSFGNTNNVGFGFGFGTATPK